MKSIADAFESLIDPKYKWKVALHKEWKSIVGNLHNAISIESIQGSVLVIGVNHPAWGQELTFLADMLLEKINKVIGERRIHSLRFRVITPSFTPMKKHSASAQKVQKMQKYTFLHEHKVCLKRIKNKDLQKVLGEYLQHCVALEHSQKT